jgi:2-polyprenyl-6-methoxyphenol hydroxylase-like FAD-dependent oxidoreductase
MTRVCRRVPIRFGTTVEGFQQDPEGVDVRLSDGSCQRVDLIVGADGIHSAVRRLAFQDGNILDLGYEAIAFTTDAPDLVRQVGNSLRTLSVPGRQITVYPALDACIATLFVRKRNVDTDSTVSDVVTDLKRNYSGIGWIVPRLIDEAGKQSVIYRDSVAQVRIPAWRTGAAVLIGDAAYAVSLIAGQGASLALAGARMLAGELAGSPADIGAALARYEEKLRPIVEAKQRAGRKLARWFVPDSGLAIAVRDLFLRISFWPAVRSLVRRAIG